MSRLSAPIFQLKRRAKALAAEEKIPLNAALNRIAASEGFTSWSLLAARHKGSGVEEAMLARLEPGDLVLIGARPMQGKTTLALNLLTAAHKAGRDTGFFTLEYTRAEAEERLRSARLDPASVLVDTSDHICADYMIEKLRGAKTGAVIVVDYLQALDQQRANAPLAAQIDALSAFARQMGLIFVFISQIDRHFDPAAKEMPDIADIRLPNRIDLTAFTKTCFLREGRIALNAGL